MSVISSQPPALPPDRRPRAAPPEPTFDPLPATPLDRRLADDRTPAQMAKEKKVTDWSALKFYQMSQVLRPKTEDDIRQALDFARKNNLTVSVAGARHSQGGQAMRENAIFLDMTEFRGANYNPQTETVTVRSGSTWLDLQYYLDKAGRSVMVKQASSPFTVGGSVSVNCHGEDPRFGTIGNTVQSMRVMLADGSIKRCSRTENADLFKHVVGGYGLFGIVLDAELSTCPNQMYTQKFQVIPTTRLPELYSKEVKPNPNKHLFLTELSIYPNRLLDEAVVWTCEVTAERDQPPPMVAPDQSKTHVLIEKLPYISALHSRFGKWRLWELEKLAQPFLGSKFVSRNDAMAMDYEFSRIPAKTHSQVIQEFFIPPDKYLEFREQLKQLAKKHDVNVVYASTRAIEQDRVSALPYAKQDMLSFVVFRDQKVGEAEQKRMDAYAREATDAALKLGGTFYLCYQLPFTNKQVRQAYPEIDAFFAKKREYDPSGLFMNSLYDRYAANVDPAPAAKAPFKDIEHVVVLMMENRSFDNMMGFLKDEDPRIDGLTGNETQPVDPSDPSKGTLPINRGGRQFGDVNPGHEFHDVMEQMYGTDKPDTSKTPPMNGFFANYLKQMPKGVPSAVNFENAKHALDGMTPDQVPVLSTLSREFVVCDRWFSSLPTSTFPNRVFLQKGDSNGHVHSAAAIQDKELRQAVFGDMYAGASIYDRLSQAHKPWKIYKHDIAWSFILPSVRAQAEHIVDISHFKEDVNNGNLPAFSLIEPAYLNSSTHKANDQDAPHDVREGERLIADVYNTLRNNQRVWDKTLLVVVYDEHGGYYDHVPPPATVAPNGLVSTTPPFDFKRLGVRVPAVLVSPRLPKREVDHTVYDHTSILRFVENLFDLEPLSERDRTANSFEHVFQSAARSDTPLELAPLPAGPELSTDSRLYGPGEPPGKQATAAVMAFDALREGRAVQNKVVKAGKGLWNMVTGVLEDAGVING